MGLLNLMGDPDFNPRAELFANGEQGLVADISPQTTLWQDSGKTTRATSPGDPVGYIEDSSGRENHVTQASSGSRPILSRVPFGGRRNLLSSSEPMATQTQTVRAVEHTLSFQGTGTVTLSGTSTAGPLVGTGASDIVSLTFTPTAGSLTLTVSGTVTLAQLEEGAARSSYQRVAIAGTVVDCTESGVPDCWYLDTSSNKWMQTAAIDFTGTDEMTVIAGVRKLSDAAAAIAELSADPTSNNGTFAIGSGALVSGDRFNWTYQGTGTANSYGVARPFASPSTIVQTLLVDIAQSARETEIIGRLNGNQQTLTFALAAADIGSGNFGNYVLYIGSRAGSSIYFNGHIFYLLVRGKTTSGSKLTRAEKYIAKKTGLTI